MSKRLSAEEKNEFKEELLEYTIVMQNFVHHEDCYDKTFCPGNHEKCKEGLDIATALLWDLQENEIWSIYRHATLINIKKLKYLADCYKAILDLHLRYHSLDEEKKLKYKDARTILEDLVELINNLDVNTIL